MAMSARLSKLLAIMLVALVSSTLFAQEVFFSVPGAAHVEAFELELTSEASAPIYYTLDGSEPTARSGILYSEPVSIDRTLLVRARVEGSERGPISAQVYTRLDPSLSDFSSDMPIVILHEFDEPIEHGVRSVAYMGIIDANEEGRSSIGNAPQLLSRIETNIRGTSSATFPKKQYATRLIDEDGNNRNEELLGMPADNNWILHAPYSDKTLMRNVVAFQLARDMGWYAPRTRYAELFLHSGNDELSEAHYHGVYVFFERIKWHEERVNIDRPGDVDSDSHATEAFIFKVDRDWDLFTDRGSAFDLVRPQMDLIDEGSFNWLRNHLNAVEESLFGPNSSDLSEGYPAYINVASFIDHHLITELLREIDGYRLSTFLYKDSHDKIVCGPLWDFNLSLGNADYMDGYQPEEWHYEQIDSSAHLHGWYGQLFADPAFAKAYKQRWWQLRGSSFSEEHLVNLVMNIKGELSEAQVRNFERWTVLGAYVWPNPVGFEERRSHRDEVEWMLNWLLDRVEWMDRQLGPATAPQLIYSWHFGQDLPNNTPLEEITCTYKQHEARTAHITFQSSWKDYPEHANPRMASMERRNSPTQLNYQSEGKQGALYSKSEMRGLQIRQPFVSASRENILNFHLPAVGYKNIQLSFSAKDEGAAEGFIVEYSLDEKGDHWQPYSDLPYPLHDDYRVYHLDFSNIPKVDGNAHFKVRLRFTGNYLMLNEGNRVTFNNPAVFGEASTTLASAEQDLIKELLVYPNPCDREVNFIYEIDERGSVYLELFDLTGRKLIEHSESHFPGRKQLLIDTSHLPGGAYIYRFHFGEEHLSGKLIRL